jgi:hypothetical protein
MTGEAAVPSRVLYAVSRDGTIVNERTGAIIVPGHFAGRPRRAKDAAPSR